MTQVRFAGSLYTTIGAAARAWAATALPDINVLERDEDPATVARDLENFCTTEARKCGLEIVPEGVDDEDAWRAACREALQVRIEASR